MFQVGDHTSQQTNKHTTPLHTLTLSYTVQLNLSIATDSTQALLMMRPPARLRNLWVGEPTLYLFHRTETLWTDDAQLRVCGRGRDQRKALWV